MKHRPNARPRLPLETTIAALAAACICLCAGCGTYSLLRSGDTLARGQVEVTGGIAANTLPELAPVVQVAYGATDRVELIAQYESTNGFVEGRYGLLSSERHGVALAIGLGAGGLDSLATSGAAATASAMLSKRFDAVELMLGTRSFVIVAGAGEGPGEWLTTGKLGVAVPISDHLRLVLEGGATVHVGEVTVGEGTAAIAARF